MTVIDHWSSRVVGQGMQAHKRAGNRAYDSSETKFLYRRKFSLIWRRKFALKIETMSCLGCRFLYLSKGREEHILQTHFRRTNWHYTGPKKSFFLITPEQLFREVLMTPRVQLRGRWDSQSRFVYYVRFHFDVGVDVSPKQHGPRRITKRVEIVCDCVKCPACLVHPPTEIVTIYPATDES